MEQVRDRASMSDRLATPGREKGPSTPAAAGSARKQRMRCKGPGEPRLTDEAEARRPMQGTAAGAPAAEAPPTREGPGRPAEAAAAAKRSPAAGKRPAKRP